MKTILYISFLNEDIRPGYKKKIHSQATAFSELGYKSYLFIVNKKGFKLYFFSNNSEEVVKEIPLARKRNKVERNVVDEFFLFIQFCKTVKGLLDEISIDYIYIRRIVPITFRLIKLIEEIKRKKIKVIYEYPTLPWKDEILNAPNISLIRKVFFVLDNLLYNKLVQKVDVVTYMGNYDGSSDKYLKIQNCGNPKDYLCKKKLSDSSKALTLIGVAHVSYIHGYDKVIDALKRYYDKGGKQEIYFNIVGTVDPSLGLEEKVKSLKLEKYVNFYGYKIGEELDQMFEQADIGINALNCINQELCQKTGITTLKTVEYTFRGLPQISSAPFTIDGDKVDKPQFLYVEKSSELNVFNVIEFYNKLSLKPEEIRDYAIEHMQWKNILKKVILLA